MEPPLPPIFSFPDDCQWQIFDRLDCERLENVRGSCRALKRRVGAYAWARIPSTLRQSLIVSQASSSVLDTLLGWLRRNKEDKRRAETPYSLWKWGGCIRVISASEGVLRSPFAFISSTDQGYQFAQCLVPASSFCRGQPCFDTFVDEGGGAVSGIPSQTVHFEVTSRFPAPPSIAVLPGKTVALGVPKGIIWLPRPLGSLPTEEGWLLPAKMENGDVAIGCSTKLRIYTQASFYHKYFEIPTEQNKIVSYKALPSGVVVLHTRRMENARSHSQWEYLVSFLPTEGTQFYSPDTVLGHSYPTAISESGPGEVSLLFSRQGKYIVWNPSRGTTKEQPLPPETNSALFLSDGRALFGTVNGYVKGDGLDLFLGPAVNDMVEVGPDLIACALSTGTIALLTTASTSLPGLVLPMKKGAAAFQHPIVGLFKLRDPSLFDPQEGVDYLMLVAKNILVSGSVESRRIHQWYLGQYARREGACLPMEQRRDRHFGCLLSYTQWRRRVAEAERRRDREAKQRLQAPTRGYAAGYV